MAVAGGEVRESARRTYSATTLPFSASLAATFWPALFSSVVVATWSAAILASSRALLTPLERWTGVTVGRTRAFSPMTASRRRYAKLSITCKTPRLTLGC